jgi:hypothetical protein
MRKLFIYIMLFCTISAAAQPLKYSITKENTDIKFVSEKLAIWDILVSTSRMTFSGGVGGKMYLNGLYLNVNYNFHYLDNLAEASSTDKVQGSSVYKPTKSRDADATIGYFFQKKTNGKVRLHLKSEGKVSYYMNAIADYNKIFGVQAGYKKGFSQLTIPGGIPVKDYYIPETGTITTEHAVVTYMQYGWLSFGPSYGKVVDVIADVEQYGIRKAQFVNRFYANVLMATSSKLEDVYYTEGFGSSNPLVHRYVLEGNVPMSKLGFNVGYETFKYTGFGVTAGVEIGLMPGVKMTGAGNGYFLFKWGFILGQGFGATKNK